MGLIILEFTSIRGDADIDIEVDGDVLVLDGVRLDFGPLPEGGILPQSAIGSPLIGSSATRQDGQVRVTVVVPCGPNAPASRKFLEARAITQSGKVVLPPFGEVAAEVSP